MSKPVLAYITEITATKGRRMEHAGAMVTTHGESAAAKVEILTECGITLVPPPTKIWESVG